MSDWTGPRARKTNIYYRSLLEAGVNEAEAKKAADDLHRERTLLDEGKCPDCKRPIARKVDQRQVGVGCADDQAWFMYRCDCGYMADWAE